MKTIHIKILDAVYCKVMTKMAVHDVWEDLSYETESRALGNRQTIYKSFIHRGTGKFPTGLLSIVVRKLEKRGYKVKVEEAEYDELEYDFPSLTVKPEDYQVRVLNKIKKPRGLIISPTGSGKTILEAGIMSLYGLPRTLIIVPQKPLLYQLRKEFKRLLGIPKVGILGDGKRNIQRITVALYQTLVRYELDEVNKLFDMVIVDEVQTGRSESIQIIMNQLTNIHYRYGFTATMRLKQPDRYIIQGLFGKPIAIVPESDTTKRVTDVKLFMLRFSDKFKNGYDYTERVRQNIWENTNRNTLIAEAVQFVVQKKKWSCLILTEKLAQAEAISGKLFLRKIDCPIIWNETPEDKRVKLLNDLDKKNIKCIIGTPAISVGVDIPNLEFLFITSEIKHWLPIVQRIGRGRRKTKGKKILYAADIFSSFGKEGKTFKRQSFKKKKVYEKRGWLQGIFGLKRFKEELNDSL
jgi:superfamily II DNA or RNA helicase